MGPTTVTGENVVPDAAAFALESHDTLACASGPEAQQVRMRRFGPNYGAGGHPLFRQVADRPEVKSVTWLWSVGHQHIGRLFAYHDASRIGVGAGQCRHY